MSVLCYCFNVEEEAVRAAVKGGATTVEAVGEKTNAGTGCGGCRAAIQAIIDEETK